MVDTIGEAGLLEKDELDDSFEPLTTQYGPEDSEDDDDESSKQIERLVEAVEIADNDEDDDEDFDYGGKDPYIHQIIIIINVANQFGSFPS